MCSQGASDDFRGSQEAPENLRESQWAPGVLQVHLRGISGGLRDVPWDVSGVYRGSPKVLGGTERSQERIGGLK